MAIVAPSKNANVDRMGNQELLDWNEYLRSLSGISRSSTCFQCQCWSAVDERHPRALGFQLLVKVACNAEDAAELREGRTDLWKQPLEWLQMPSVLHWSRSQEFGAHTTQ